MDMATQVQMLGVTVCYELNYHDQKIRRTLTHDIRKHWTAVSTSLGLISGVYRDLHNWESSQRPQIAEPKLYNCAISSYRTQVMPNWLVMVNGRLINLNVSFKLQPYSSQLPPGLRLPKRIRNTHPRNYYNLKGMDIDVYFFLVEELCEIQTIFHTAQILVQKVGFQLF